MVVKKIPKFKTAEKVEKGEPAEEWRPPTPEEHEEAYRKVYEVLPGIYKLSPLKDKASMIISYIVEWPGLTLEELEEKIRTVHFMDEAEFEEVRQKLSETQFNSLYVWPRARLERALEILLAERWIVRRTRADGQFIYFTFNHGTIIKDGRLIKEGNPTQ